MLDNVPFLSEYNDGKGICIHLENNRCRIYGDRPDLCNIETMYTTFVKNEMTNREFFEKNLMACIKISTIFGEKRIKDKLEELLKLQDCI
jgi:Fe-S-cluster containining protein